MINIPTASLVNYFMIYIEYIMENYFAIWHNSDYAKHNMCSLASFQRLKFLQDLQDHKVNKAPQNLLLVPSLVATQLFKFCTSCRLFLLQHIFRVLKIIYPDPVCTRAFLNSWRVICPRGRKGHFLYNTESKWHFPAEKQILFYWYTLECSEEAAE